MTLRTLLSIPCLWLIGCGPTITLDGGDLPVTTAATTDESPVTTAVTTGTNPPVTSVGTTVPPDDTTLPPLDTGVFDTGEPWLDLPEHCSIFEQDCPPGYKCMPWASDGGSTWNDTKCSPLDPDPGAPGDPCTVQGNGVSGVDDCDGTSMCWNVDPRTNEGTCVPFCIGDESNPTCADPCDYCTLSSDGVITLCLESCDPITQNCAPGQACYPIYDTFVCAPDSTPEGTGIGSPCEYINVCPPGMFCLEAAVVPGCMGTFGCCAPVCPAGGADPCPGLLPGSECVPWYSEGEGPPEGCLVSDPGACMIPM